MFRVLVLFAQALLLLFFLAIAYVLGGSFRLIAVCSIVMAVAMALWAWVIKPRLPHEHDDWRARGKRIDITPPSSSARR